MKAKIMAMMLVWGVSKLLAGRQGESNSHEVREHDRVLELARQPDEVEGVLVDRHLLGERGGVVGAQPAAAVRVDADAEVAHAGLEVGLPREPLDGRVGGVVYLGRVGPGDVVVVVEGYQEDVGDERARRRAPCEEEGCGREGIVSSVCSRWGARGLRGVSLWRRRRG